MKFPRFIPFVVLAAATASCDEGRIPDDYDIENREGITARITTSMTGADEWPDNYTLVLAGFADGNEYALISKNVENRADGRCDMVLVGIPPEVSTVELCAIDRLRRRVASFAKVDCRTDSDTVLLVSYKVDVSPATAIQTEIFNTTCIQCHGRSNFAAAGLDLTDGNAFADLVGVESVKEPDFMRVEAGNSASSVLYRILSTDQSASWNYDHSVEVVTSAKLDLIKDWIDAGAKHRQ